MGKLMWTFPQSSTTKNPFSNDSNSLKDFVCTIVPKKTVDIAELLLSASKRVPKQTLKHAMNSICICMYESVARGKNWLYPQKILII